MPPTSDPTPPRARRRAIFTLGGAVAVMLGILGGLGTFTLGYGDGLAYMRDDPTACTSCHVMQDHFDAWVGSSHHGVATCNDCHLPHHPIGKWVTKADNGFFHSLAFTTGDYPDPIRIKPRNRRVTQGACLSCHAGFVHAMLPPQGKTGGNGGETMQCIHCHQDVGHAQR